MDEKEKQAYLEKYHHEKEKGVPFFPDIIFKDTVVILVIFVALAALAYFAGAPLEERANPADTNYTPRPEWYFLFLFQLLKYFPGYLEVIGVVVLPTIGISLLFFLPLLDRSSKRHFINRPIVTGATLIGMIAIIGLTVLSIREAPPPAEAAGGDAVAALYIRNCASCHGASIQVATGTNLHNVIAEGKHEGMPSWSADLTSDQIDALAGFILSPGGSSLFAANCSACHSIEELVASSPVKLKEALGSGLTYEPHKGLQLPDWSKTLTPEQQTQLLNFLAAPDGQRLFATNCSACHGRYVAYSGEKEQLTKTISQGGVHLDMPAWKQKFSEAELQQLARYVVDPATAPEGKKLFQDQCAACHGERVPTAATVDEAYDQIANGGAHQTMPVWGQVLTPEQLDALVNYIIQANQGEDTEAGQKLFESNCAGCHGQFGEGGPNPARPNSVITPISSEEFLKTRDDITLAAIIALGQPDLGMGAFGNAAGGPLSDEDINSIVAYMRSWETNPPVVTAPEIEIQTLVMQGGEIYQQICAQCHGVSGEGNVGPALSDKDFQAKNNDQAIYDTISKGHNNTSMIAWGDILTPAQINQLVAFIRQMPPTEKPATPKPAEGQDAGNPPAAEATPTVTPTPKAASAPVFADIEPILKKRCAPCHGAMGGWDASTSEKVINSGDHGPAVIPGDAENSLLEKKLLGTQTDGTIMPPGGKLSEKELNLILEWIKAGAK